MTHGDPARLGADYQNEDWTITVRYSCHVVAGAG